MQHKNKTVVRSMDLLQLFFTHAKLTMNDMVKLSGIPKTSVHRMIKSLEEMGFLTKHADGGYTLGLLCLQLGQLVAERLDIRRVALPLMHKLREDTDEAVHLVLRDGDSCIYVEKLDTDHPVRLFTQIGRRAPLYAGASSRTILAFLPEEERLAYMEAVELKPIASGTLVRREQLLEALDDTQANGYSVSRSELEDYTAELSAPLLDHTGSVAGAVSIAALEVRFEEQKLPEWIECVRLTASGISRQLGYKGAFPGLIKKEDLKLRQ